MKHRRTKKNRGVVTKVIVYRDGSCPGRQTREVTIDVRGGEVVDTAHAAAMVAVRTGTALKNVRVMEVREK